ncbi:response regulator transcription factor [Magnetococcus sp. PR-3]|uniref:response regulator transcription factor n=1 Tax=Magnetococcus sp. PR-3 TaxID=3120355 RepID=UPI002FCDE375
MMHSFVKQKILLIEDEASSRFICENALAKEGFEVVSVGNAESGWRLAKEAPYDLFIVDLLLPDMDGLTLIEKLKSHFPEIPVLIMSIRGAPKERSEGFEKGASDYLIKPFNVVELNHRVCNLIKCHVRHEGEQDKRFQQQFGAWVLETQIYRLMGPDDVVIQLTRGESTILLALAQAGERTVSREMLSERIERKDGEGHLRTVDVLISRIRRKVRSIEPPPFEVVTVPEMGYRLTVFGA